MHISMLWCVCVCLLSCLSECVLVCVAWECGFLPRQCSWQRDIYCTSTWQQWQHCSPAGWPSRSLTSGVGHIQSLLWLENKTSSVLGQIWEYNLAGFVLQTGPWGGCYPAGGKLGTAGGLLRRTNTHHPLRVICFLSTYRLYRNIGVHILSLIMKYL